MASISSSSGAKRRRRSQPLTSTIAMSAATSTRKRLRSMIGSECRLAATDAANTVPVMSSALTARTCVRRVGRFMGNGV
jgi:hypothetical protein